MSVSNSIPTMAEVQRMIEPYRHPSTPKALWQLANTLIPYFGLWALMIYTLKISYWLTLPIAILAGGFLIRIFIIFHDCGHQSFFPSRKANRIVGFFLGLFALTPSENWWRSHAIHHATNGNLDKRGMGDVETLTVDEYQNSSLFKKISYRIFRFPPIMFGLGPFFIFVIGHRFPTLKLGKKAVWNVMLTNLALAVITLVMSLLIGFWPFVTIQLTVMWIAGILGIWLFYVEHQFENMYWVHNDEWNYVTSALYGASYYQLPKILQWFSGNIGFHNIHHLSPRIPNYNLEKCCKELPEFKQYANILTLRSSLNTLGLALWDEKNKKLIRFRDLKSLQAA